MLLLSLDIRASIKVINVVVLKALVALIIHFVMIMSRLKN